MSTQRKIQHMLRHPNLYSRFLLTGRLPQGVVPDSPLLRAIEKIAPRDRARMTGFLVAKDLGYSGSRRFHSVAQALQWLAPHPEVFGAFPAESWRIKTFRKTLTFEDIAAQCAAVPEDIRARYRDNTV